MTMPETGFIKNVNTVAAKIAVIESANEIFDEGVVVVLQEIAQLDLDEAIIDLKKGNYLGNRKLDLNLALNMVGVTEDLILVNPDAAEAIWVDPAKTVQYDSATVTFSDGVVIQLPFIFDGSPTTVATHADLLAQLSRYDYINAIRQVDTVNLVSVINNGTYSVTINGTVLTYVSDANATIAEVVTGMVNVINLNAVPVTAYEAGVAFVLRADVIGTAFTATTNANMTVSTTTANRETVISETAFLAKLNHTTLASFASDVVGEIIRAYDVAGQTSNLERIQLHAVSGQYIDPNPIYFWAKTTSAFQTLSMRAGDIIKLGNDIDAIIALASRISEMTDLQNKMPQLVTNGDSLYTNIAKLVVIYEQITGLVAVYNDIKVGGTNFINDAVIDLRLTDSKIRTVANDLQLGNASTLKIVKDAIASVISVAASINNVNTVSSSIGNVNIIAPSITNVNAVGLSIANVNIAANSIASINTVAPHIGNVNIIAPSIAGVNTVSTSITNVNTVATSVASVNTVAPDIAKVNTVSASIASVNTVATNIASVNTNTANIVAIQNASANANAATTQAGIATTQAGIATTQAGISTTQANASTTQAGIAATQAGIATNQAAISTAQAVVATNKANSILGLTTQAATGAAGSLATVSYNPVDGKMTFSIPQGVQGLRGEAFTVNAVGLAADRGLYDSQIRGFSFLSIDGSLVYFKLSNTTGDWSVGSPFGKGEKGDIGLTGNGVTSVSFLSTTHVSGVAGSPGGTDTYRITTSNATTFNFLIYNGLNGVLINDAALSLIATWSNQKISNELELKAPLDSPAFTGTVSGVTASMVGLGNVNNTSDADKPVSTAQATAIALKANTDSPTFTGTVGGITAAMVGAPSGSGNSSGTNTGDQTNITGNAGTASALSVGADRTKLDGIAVGATANVGDVTLAGTQTLEYKTLTAPVINNPTGTGFVTSVNGLEGDVVLEISSPNGLAMFMASSF